MYSVDLAGGCPGYRNKCTNSTHPIFSKPLYSSVFQFCTTSFKLDTMMSDAHYNL